MNKNIRLVKLRNRDNSGKNAIQRINENSPPTKKLKFEVAADFFPLESLPDDVLKIVLDKLDIKDKKNLRETSSGYNRKIILLDPLMRKWKITMTKFNYTKEKRMLDRARKNPLSSLRRYELKLEVSSLDKNTQLDALEKILGSWQTEITSLALSISGYERFFIRKSKLKFPNLQELSLKEFR